MKYHLHMALPDDSFSPADQLRSASDSCNVKSSLVFLAHTPCLDSNSGIVSHGHTHRLGAWRLQNPVAGGLGSYYSVFIYRLRINHGRFSTVDTMMGPQCRGMRAADRVSGRAIAVNSRGALGFDMLLTLADLQLQRSHSFFLKKKKKKEIYVFCTD